MPVARSVEETGLQVAAERIAVVLEATSWDGEQNLIEIVFMGSERDRNAGPLQVEERLAAPAFVRVAQRSYQPANVPGAPEGHSQASGQGSDIP